MAPDERSKTSRCKFVEPPWITITITFPKATKRIARALFIHEVQQQTSEMGWTSYGLGTEGGIHVVRDYDWGIPTPSMSRLWVAKMPAVIFDAGMAAAVKRLPMSTYCRTQPQIKELYLAVLTHRLR